MLTIFSNVDIVRRRSPDVTPICRVPNQGPLHLQTLPIRVEDHHRNNPNAVRYLNLIAADSHLRAGTVKSRIVNNISVPCRVAICTEVHAAVLEPDECLSFVDISTDAYSPKGVVEHVYDIHPDDASFIYEDLDPNIASTVEVGLRIEPLSRSVTVANKTTKTFRLVIFHPVSHVLYNFIQQQ